jgi:hypothetical protein
MSSSGNGASNERLIKRAEEQLEDLKRQYNSVSSVTLKPFIAQQIREQEEFIAKLKGY